ncbi:PHP domain-containing protein [Paenibacillus radicis (ex Gao et al. 2016)]|uniref:PHP-like protein n=1 Tax=Paenibacillus radicis (ex Gao et al. 2016) TaxID=1737354 RepID=A0A917HTG5_9BACL|nr:PHP domain-containing protein [Paenibacillus radicis (ex Gao et al. 2016)]GGG89452.1 PHP-like protein [Paenibacillus radicis (ex Gao et al. 2016)]
MAVTSNGKADLHTHTTASDGTRQPADNVRLAKEAGLSAVAITDHDTMAGVEEAIAEGERIGITVVPGVELSTVAEGRDIHILGYYTDWRDVLWQERLAGLRGTRDQRNEMIVERLVQLGVSITMDEVIRAAASSEAAGDGNGSSARAKGKTIGRPHIAEVLLNKGVVSTMKEAFDLYLAEGAAAYVNPPRLHPFEAIEWIREAGGTSVIAHPGLYGDDELVEKIVRRGIEGIEAYHSDHDAEAEARYVQMAERHGLLVTGGSDYHGERQGKVFHGAIGSRTVNADVLRQLNKRNRD